VRLLFAFAGGQGHLDPLVPLAHAARSAGHEVAVTGRAELVPAIRELGFQAIESPGDQPDPAARMPLKAYDPADEERVLREWYAGTLARRRADALIELASQWGAGAIVRDEADYGARVAAERLGLPSACVPVVIGPFVPPEAVAAPISALRAAHGLAGEPPGETILSPFPPSLRPIPGASCFRGGSPPAADGDAVYLTLGTVFNAESGDLLQRALTGVREVGLPVVVTTGRQIDPAELGPQPPHVRVQRWIPQGELLPWCRAVVCQGGSGIVTGALAHGLASVLLPVGADQPHTAARIAELGAGVVLDPLTATPDLIAGAVRLVLDDPSYAAAAARLREAFLALPSAADAVARVTG
jgi:UDP:flavonoid glycosyltransferase YjiC (YdhE family)